MDKLFSILTVNLNSGDKLLRTLESIECQTFKDYEIIIKDGGSTDGSLNLIDKFKHLPIRLINCPDKGIYDAMNQAVSYAEGKYVYFLNCGDYFYDEGVLSTIASVIENKDLKKDAPKVIYGDIFDRISGQVVPSNPNINGFACYRNVPCHQACFYDRSLVSAHPFNAEYKIRADYEQFLWCFYEKGADFVYERTVIADYEGGGFSESGKSIALSKKEHKIITEKYMSSGELFKYRLIMLLTFSGLRTKIARNPATAGLYNFVKKKVYKR